MHFSQKIPAVVVERRIQLADLALARAAVPVRPSWYAIFAKAYAIVSAERPELRRSYMSLPWPRLFEHARNIAVVPIERRLGEEDVVLNVPLPDPETRSLEDLDASIRHHKNEPIANIPFFRTQLRTSRLPWPLRRLMWWIGLNLWGRVRAFFYGTFGLTGVGAFGANLTTVQSPLTTTLFYDAFDRDGSVQVHLGFDHRVMDGHAAAVALGALEEVLHGEILEELRGMKGAAVAA
jgi:hypothetical protein